MKEHETRRQLMLRALQRFELEPGRAWQIGEEIEAELTAEKSQLEADAAQVTAAEADGSRAFPYSAKAKASELPPWPKKPRGRGKYVRVFDLEVADSLFKGIGDRYGDRDDRSRAQSLAKRIRAAGPWRRVASVPADWRQRLAKLQHNFPHFGPVFGSLRASLALSERQGGAIGIRPQLWDGPPGIGKTMFAEAMSNALGLPLLRIDMASAQCGARLSGSEDYWTNSKPGLPFEILACGAHGGIANAVVLLDEIEKTSAWENDPLGALYSLLEPVTAKSFSDLALPLPFDAGSLIWIATANSVDGLAEPIRSRLRVFHIAKPDAHQARGIAQRMYRQAAERYMPGVELPELGEEALAILATMTPRGMASAIEQAFGRAADQERHELRADDFPPAGVSKRRAGFV